jgi:hypothetical protein
VADDEELDRVGDVDLIGSGRLALGPGRPIAVRLPTSCAPGKPPTATGRPTRPALSGRSPSTI